MIVFKLMTNKTKIMSMANKYNIEAFQRMCEVLKEKGIDIPRFQATLGILSQHWTNWGHRGIPSKEHATIANSLGVHLEWLMRGTGEKYKSQDRHDRERRRGIPLIQWNQIKEWVEDDFAETTIFMPQCREPHSPKTYAIQVDNDSMTAKSGNRSYPPGAIVYVDPNRDILTGSRVIVGADVGGCRLREYVIDGNIIYLKPLNNRYPMQEMSNENKIYGVVIGTYLPE
jgi:SOS-response transcriptional repressor LexA